VTEAVPDAALRHDVLYQGGNVPELYTGAGLDIKFFQHHEFTVNSEQSAVNSIQGKGEKIKRIYLTPFVPLSVDGEGEGKFERG